MIVSAAAFAAGYLVFGPVRMGFPNQCHPQPTGEAVCTLMALPPRPESLFGLVDTWWVPLLAAVVVGVIVAVWRLRSGKRLASQAG